MVFRDVQHPTIIDPRTGQPLRAIFVGRRPFWPVMGGSEPTVEQVTPASDPSTPDPTAQPDAGFPANTAVLAMTAPQQAAYWRHQARKHEDRVKALGLTPEQAAELRQKAARHDALERELMSDKDKQIAEAKESAEAAARAVWVPQVVRARIEASAAGRIATDKLDAIVEPLDLAKFLTPSGEIDTAKVTTFVDSIAPTVTTPAGPSAHGQGVRGGITAPASLASGQELYRARRGRKTA